ncbi:MAG: hypothetical protein ACR2O3_00735 [Rhizobiaceae bacterium]
MHNWRLVRKLITATSGIRVWWDQNTNMRLGLVFSALLSIIMLPVIAGDVYAQSRNFKEPHVRGVRLDLCKHQGGRGCGKPSADLFCKEMNYSRSIGHKIDRRTGEQLGRTLIFGDGALCTGYTCRAFASILCMRDEVVKTPAPKKPVPPKKKKPAPEKKTEKKPAPKKPEKPKKKKSETAKLPPKKPSSPKIKVAPIPRPKPEIKSTETVELQDDFLIIPMKVRKILPAGAKLTRCILNELKCPYPVTTHTGIKPDGVNKLKRFQWDISAVPDATVALWQVSTVPFPAFAGEEESTNFKELTKWSVVAHPADNRGSFEIDFNTVIAEANLDAPPESFYVRIIPLSGLLNGKPVGLPSNVIRVYYGGQEPPAPEIDMTYMQEHLEALVEKPLFSVRIKSFTPPIFDTGNKWGCVVVVEHPKWWSEGIGITAQVGKDFANHYPVGAELCPKPYRGDSGKITNFDDFVEFVFDAWDWVGNRYDDLIDIAVTVTLKATGFGQQCLLVAELTNESSVEDVCESGARVAVNAGMVALGLPPSIPSYNELVDKGVDHAVELAIAEFEAKTGVPCLGPCEDALRAGFEAAAEEIKRQPDRTACVDPKEARKHGREPMCLPEDLVVRPAPGTQYVPPVAEIEITRRPDVELPWGKKHPDCYAFARLEFNNFFPGGIVYGKTTQQSVQVNAQAISGDLFKAQYRDLQLNMPQSESVTMALIFDDALKHQFPWTKKLWQTSQITQRDELGPFGPNWFQLFLESQMTMTAGSNCSEHAAQLQMTMPPWQTH